MGGYTNLELEEALRTMEEMIGRSEKAQIKFAQGTAQHTLQKNRIAALYIASALVREELTGQKAGDGYTKEELEQAAGPIASLIGKSEKAQQKLAPGSWQYKMLDKNLKALRIASPLLARALGPASGPT